MKEASKELCLEGADAGLPVCCNVIALLWNAPGSHMQLGLCLFMSLFHLSLNSIIAGLMLYSHHFTSLPSHQTE